MQTKEIIQVFLEVSFGNQAKKALKQFINDALDQGEYFDGFEIAVRKNELDYQEFDDLYGSFEKAYKQTLPEIDAIKKIVEQELPQSYYTTLSWLVSSKGEMYLTDGLRVIKIFKSRLLWATKRISYDGIELVKLENNELHGKWFNPLNDASPWSELVLSSDNGTLVKGEVIDS